jgi:hypothetical protein
MDIRKMDKRPSLVTEAPVEVQSTPTDMLSGLLLEASTRQNTSVIGRGTDTPSLGCYDT